MPNVSLSTTLTILFINSWSTCTYFVYFKSKKELNNDRFVDLNILGAARLVHSDLRVYQISFFLLDMAPAWLEQNLKLKVSATDYAVQNLGTFLWTPYLRLGLD